MLTPDQMKEHSFTLVENGRYSAEEVNRYFGEVIASYNQMYRENGELIRKISILANKVQDYRRDEDNIRNALLNAQRTSERILADAQKQADSIVELANKEMRDIVDGRDGIVTKANTDAQSILNDAHIKAENIIASAMQQAEEIDFSAKAAAGEAQSNAQEQAEKILADANSEAMGILVYARQEAEKISADANAAADAIRAEAEREKKQKATPLDESASGVVIDAQKQAQEILEAATKQAKALLESADDEAKQKNVDCEMQLREIRAKIAASEERLNALRSSIAERGSSSDEAVAEIAKSLESAVAEQTYADENGSFDDFSEDALSGELPLPETVSDAAATDDIFAIENFTEEVADVALTVDSDGFDSFDDFFVDEALYEMGFDGESRDADDLQQVLNDTPVQTSAQQIFPDQALQDAASDAQTNFVVHVNTDDFGEYREEEIFDDFGATDETNRSESFDAQSDDFATFDDSLISSENFVIDFSLFENGESEQATDVMQENAETTKSVSEKKSRKKKNKKKK